MFTSLPLQFVLSTSVYASEVTIVGWSPDEEYFAVRTIHGIATDAEIEANREGRLHDRGPHAEPVGFCPGYMVPGTDRPFSGDLQISIYQISSGVDGAATVQLYSPPVTIYHAGYREDDVYPSKQYSCTSPKMVAKNLRRAKDAMSDVGITMNPDAHQTLEFVEHKLGTTTWEKSNFYQVTAWKYIAEKERLRPGQYDAEPVRVEISLDHFSSHTEATHALVGHVYLLEDKHSENYSVKSAEQVMRPDRKESHLLNVQSLSHSYDAQLTGDGGVDLIGVYTSPSNRVVIFAISLWSYNDFSLRSDEYQFPFAYERWDLD